MTSDDSFLDVQLDRERWMKVWQRVALNAADAGPVDELCRLYGETARSYHNAMHVNSCLREFDGVRMLVSDPLSLELAIWFHDAIYDARASDNEERSAQRAADAIQRAGGAGALAERVTGLILATKTHQPGAEPDARWLIDIDLAILGQAPDEFDAYEAAVRAEYAWVEPTVFCAKRAQLLAGFLARPQIYLTPFFRERFEAAARENVLRSIERLKRGLRLD